MIGTWTWRRALTVGAGVILLYGIFLLATLPATWLSKPVSQATRGTLHLLYVDGTAWSGNGRLAMGKTTARELGQIHWSINPLWLVLGRVQLNVKLTGATTGQGQLQLGYRTLTLKDFDVALPAEIAAALYSPAAFVSPKGFVRLRTGRLDASGKGLNGNAEIFWNDASARLSGDAPLGDYRLDLAGNGENAQLSLATVSGRLQLSGQGQWQTTTGNVRFQGSASASDPSLGALLNILGPDQGGGRRALSANLTLPIANFLLP